MKKILLITRPIAPPWDEASKNFAYFLAKNVPDVKFGLLVEKIMPDLPENIVQYPIYSSGSLGWREKFDLLKVRKIISRDKFDAVHFMLTPNKLNSFAFKFILGRKIKTIQTVATLREDLYSKNGFRKILFADLIITYSDYARNKLREYGFENVQKIYPGIDTQLYSPSAKDAAIMEEFNLSASDFVVQYFGEYIRLGAMDDLVEMVIKYANEFRKRKIIITFPGRLKDETDKEKRDSIKNKLSDLGYLDIVRFTDGVQQRFGMDFMRRKYNTSDLAIFPVRNMKGKFDVPLAIIEAFACEKTVVVSDLPILQEFSNSDHSVIIKSGDIDSLFSAIIDLYNHPEKRAALGKKAREYVLNNFDIKKTALEYKKVYEQI